METEGSGEQSTVPRLVRVRTLNYSLRSRSYEIGNTLGNKHAGLLLAKEKNNLVITYLKVPSLKSDETQHRLRSWIRANRKDIWQECKRRYTDRLSGVHEEDIEIG